MEQHPIQSQTAQFNANKSQTTTVLFQHPTASEQRVSRRGVIIANIKEFSLFILIAILCWLVISFFLTFVFGG